MAAKRFLFVNVVCSAPIFIYLDKSAGTNICMLFTAPLHYRSVLTTAPLYLLRKNLHVGNLRIFIFGIDCRASLFACVNSASTVGVVKH